MEQTTLYAYIRFIGNDDFSLDVVTESLGVQPTKTWEAGEKVHKDKPLKRYYTCWIYETEKLATLVVEDVLDPLYDLFNSKVDIINKLKTQLHLEVQI